MAIYVFNFVSYVNINPIKEKKAYQSIASQLCVYCNFKVDICSYQLRTYYTKSFKIPREQRLKLAKLLKCVTG